jgi:hypothetical protein
LVLGRFVVERNGIAYHSDLTSTPAIKIPCGGLTKILKGDVNGVTVPSIWLQKNSSTQDIDVSPQLALPVRLGVFESVGSNPPESMSGKPKTSGKKNQEKSEHYERELSNFSIAPKFSNPIFLFLWCALCVIASLYFAGIGYAQIERGRWFGLLPLWGSVLLAGAGTVGIFIVPLVLQ